MKKFITYPPTKRVVCLACDSSEHIEVISGEFYENMSMSGWDVKTRFKCTKCGNSED